MVSEGGKKIKHAVRRRKQRKRKMMEAKMHKKSGDDMNDLNRNLNAFNQLNHNYTSRRRRSSGRKGRKRRSTDAILPQYTPINGYYPTETLNVFDDYFNPSLWD